MIVVGRIADVIVSDRRWANHVRSRRVCVGRLGLWKFQQQKNGCEWIRTRWVLLHELMMLLLLLWLLLLMDVLLAHIMRTQRSGNHRRRLTDGRGGVRLGCNCGRNNSSSGCGYLLLVVLLLLLQLLMLVLIVLIVLDVVLNVVVQLLLQLLMRWRRMTLVGVDARREVGHQIVVERMMIGYRTDGSFIVGIEIQIWNHMIKNLYPFAVGRRPIEINPNCVIRTLATTTSRATDCGTIYPLWWCSIHSLARHNSWNIIKFKLCE